MINFSIENLTLILSGEDVCYRGSCREVKVSFADEVADSGEWDAISSLDWHVLIKEAGEGSRSQVWISYDSGDCCEVVFSLKNSVHLKFCHIADKKILNKDLVLVAQIHDWAGWDDEKGLESMEGVTLEEFLGGKIIVRRGFVFNLS